MRILCLTGGIATGKSTVANMFKGLGVPLIDTDVLAREVLNEDTEAIGEVKNAFGDAVFEDGAIDRLALAKRIFDDLEARKTLNHIVHPRVRARMNARLESIRKKGKHRVALVDVPLLFESGFDDACDDTITVYTDEATQLERLIERDGISESYALRKIRAQMPLEKKKERSDFTIDNSKDLTHTKTQVQSILRKAGDA